MKFFVILFETKIIFLIETAKYSTGFNALFPIKLLSRKFLNLFQIFNNKSQFNVPLNFWKKDFKFSIGFPDFTHNSKYHGNSTIFSSLWIIVLKNSITSFTTFEKFLIGSKVKVFIKSTKNFKIGINLFKIISFNVFWKNLE